MAKKATPLRARRVKAHSSQYFDTLNSEQALLSYPFADISPDLQVDISERAKRLALRLDPKQRVVRLVIPKRASLRKAYDFAEDNRDWIENKINGLSHKILFQDGETLPVFGRDRDIIVLYNKALKVTDIKLKRHEILVLTNKNEPSSRIQRFLMDRARDKITALAQDKAEDLGKPVKSVTIRDTSSRWGSCSSDGRLSFSWRLIFAPPKVLDYVVAHEVAHLAYMDHSPAFWRVCESLSKDYHTGKDWIRRNGHELMRYGE